MSTVLDLDGQKLKGELGTKKEVDYCYQFYPVRGIGKTLEYTNVNMLTHSYIPLTKGEFFKYLGLGCDLRWHVSLKGEPSLCIGMKVYSLAQYTVVQALVNALGCPDIDLRTLLSAFCHRLEFVKHSPAYSGTRGRKQRKCRICSAKSSYYCVGCSRVKDNDLYGCCEPATRDCFKNHLKMLGFA